MAKYRYRVTAVPGQGWVCEVESFSFGDGWCHEWTFPGASTREIAKSYFDRWLTERNDGWTEVEV